MAINFDSLEDILEFSRFVCDSFDGPTLSKLSFLNDKQLDTIFNAVYDFMNIFAIEGQVNDI